MENSRVFELGIPLFHKIEIDKNVTFSVFVYHVITSKFSIYIYYQKVYYYSLLFQMVMFVCALSVLTRHSVTFFGCLASYI